MPLSEICMDLEWTWLGCHLIKGQTPLASSKADPTYTSSYSVLTSLRGYMYPCLPLFEMGYCLQSATNIIGTESITKPQVAKSQVTKHSLDAGCWLANTPNTLLKLFLALFIYRKTNAPFPSDHLFPSYNCKRFPFLWYNVALAIASWHGLASLYMP